MRYLSRMYERGIRLDVKGYVRVIWELCNNGQLYRALEMRKEMEGRGLIPDKFIFNNLMDVHFKAGDVKKGLDLHNERLIKGFELDLSTTSAGFASMGFCRRQKYIL